MNRTIAHAHTHTHCMHPRTHAHTCARMDTCTHGQVQTQRIRHTNNQRQQARGVTQGSPTDNGQLPQGGEKGPRHRRHRGIPWAAGRRAAGTTPQKADKLRFNRRRLLPARHANAGIPYCFGRLRIFCSKSLFPTLFPALQVVNS